MNFKMLLILLSCCGELFSVKGEKVISVQDWQLEEEESQCILNKVYLFIAVFMEIGWHELKN